MAEYICDHAGECGERDCICAKPHKPRKNICGNGTCRTSVFCAYPKPRGKMVRCIPCDATPDEGEEE